jgi:hypothetical protein
LFKEYSLGDYYLVSKCGVYGGTYKGNWRLVQTADTGIFYTEFESETKAAKVSKEIGLWLLGYLNTEDAKLRVKDWCRLGASHGDWFAIVASNTFKQCQVPDFDFYKADRPDRFQTYMKWIEESMRNKGKFLAEIDQEFKKLIE